MLIVGELWAIAIGFHWRSSGQTVLASKSVTVWVHELCLLPISLKQWLHSERLPLICHFVSKASTFFNSHPEFQFFPLRMRLRQWLREDVGGLQLKQAFADFKASTRTPK